MMFDLITKKCEHCEKPTSYVRIPNTGGHHYRNHCTCKKNQELNGVPE